MKRYIPFGAPVFFVSFMLAVIFWQQDRTAAFDECVLLVSVSLGCAAWTWTAALRHDRERRD